MATPDVADAAAELAALWRRILGGEDAAAVLADLDRCHAERQAAFEAERERLQAEIDALTAAMLRHEGRLQ